MFDMAATSLISGRSPGMWFQHLLMIGANGSSSGCRRTCGEVAGTA